MSIRPASDPMGLAGPQQQQLLPTPGAKAQSQGSNSIYGATMGAPPKQPAAPNTSQGTPFQSQAQLPTFKDPGHQEWYDSIPTFYPGSTVAGMSPEQMEYLQNTAGTAGQLQQMLMKAMGSMGSAPGNVGRSGQLNSALQRALNEMLEQGNPYQQQAIDAAVRPLEERFTNEILPTLGSKAQQAGAWGGSRQGIVEGLAAGQTAQAIGDTSGRVAYDTYNRALGTFDNALNAEVGLRGQDVAQRGQTIQHLLGQMNALPGLASGINTAAGVGAGAHQQLQNYDQRLIDADRERHDYGQNADHMQLARMNQLLSGGGNVGGSSGQTSTVQMPDPSNMQQILAALSAGAGTYDTWGPMVEDLWGWLTGGDAA